MEEKEKTTILCELSTKNIKTYEEKYREKFKKITAKNLKDVFKDAFGEKEINDMVIKDTEFAFDVKQVKGHKMIVPISNEDVSPYIKDMINAETEIFKIFNLDEKNHILKCETFNIGDETHSNFNTRTVFEYLISHKIKRYMIIHNHPMYIGASFSEGDNVSDYASTALSRALSIKFVDSAVVTKFDYISRFQEEKDKMNRELYLTGKKNKMLTGNFCSYDLIDKIKKENRWLGVWLQMLKHNEIK